MTKLIAIVIFLLVAFYDFHSSVALIEESFAKIFGSLVSIKNVRIPELFNQLCNLSQGDVVVAQDACYGCFQRASNQATGYPLLLALSNCANSYLGDTNYRHCQAYLTNATTNINPRTSTTRIYCTFLECIRQVNKNTLLQDCVGEAVRDFPNFNRSDVQLAQLFVNTTACVLAKTRCGTMNPITGEFQEEDIIASKLHIPSINAILVNSDYDINIVQLPFRHGSLDICAKYRNIEQATWPTVQC
ncbi:uncharacterized protein [Prorops nasuta]|uniref:uncharacterized protein n=1 Tax=Prorops nasuta TaxID=863751 RepID=UPI0034CF6F6E